MKLTKHAKRRMKERISKTNHTSIIKNVKRYGLKPHQFEGRIQGYLNYIGRKHRRCPIVYKGNVYCISGGTIITVFPLPLYLQKEYEDWLIEKEKTNVKP